MNPAQLHTNGRHRRDGRRPSGNRSGSRNKGARRPSSHPKYDMRAGIATIGPSEPRARLQVAKSPADEQTTMINDPTRSRSPTRLWRSRVTTRSPTRENIVNARANGMVVTTSWPFRKWKTKPGTKVPTKAAKTNHGHLARSGVGLASAPVDLSI